MTIDRRRVRHGYLESFAADDDLRPAVTAHFVMEAIAFAIRSPDPRRALEAAFDVIVDGASIG